MKHSKRYLLLFSLLFMAPAASMKADCGTKDCDTEVKDCAKDCCTGCSTSVNLWLPRSFSAGAYREVLSRSALYRTQNDGDWIGTWAVTPEYQRNIDNCKKCSLGARPFWSGDNTLTVGSNGLQWTDSSETATEARANAAQLDAYQFGLGDLSSVTTLELNPRVQRAASDIFFYLAENNHSRGFYAALRAPVEAFIMRHNLSERGVESKNADDNSAIFAVYPAPANRPDNMVDAFQGGSVDVDAKDGGLLLPGAARRSIILERAKLASCCDLTAIRIPDLTLSMGYNVFGRDNAHVGVGLRVSMPTGNVPVAEYALEPISGRGGAWGLGGEISAHYDLWEGDCDNKLTMWFQGDVMHLFAGRTVNWRTFDLKQNGQGSKYLLVQYYHPGYPTVANSVTPVGLLVSYTTTTGNLAKYGTPGTSNFTGYDHFGTADGFVAPITAPLDHIHASDINQSLSAVANPTGRIATYLTQAANITTLPVKSSFAVEGNFALLFDYQHGNWNMGVGYDFWGRSCEKLKLDKCTISKLELSNLNDFAVLGRQADATYNFDIPGAPINFEVLVPAPLSAIATHTLTAGQIVPRAADLCEPLAQIGNSLPRYSHDLSYANDYVKAHLADGRQDANRIPASTNAALDIDGARQKVAFMSTVFGNAGYMWKEHKHTPMLSLTGAYQFSHSDNNAVPFWAVGLNGSVNF